MQDHSDALPPLPFGLMQVEVGPHENFHYVLACPETRQAAIVDPAFELDAIWAAAEARGWTITTALITHGHWDHIGGIDEAVERGVQRIVLHEKARNLPQLREVGPYVRLVKDDAEIQVGTLTVRLLHTPGHQEEGACYLVDDAALFGGDTLFVGSCGRTDFPGGDTPDMFDSMRRLAQLPDDIVVFPGHHYHEEAWATLGTEKARNPALATTEPAEFVKLACLSS